MSTYRLKIILFFCTVELFFPFLSSQVIGKDFIVVLDPGHGGNDPGAIGKIGKEKNINLKVALKVGNLIRANSPSTKVIFTRANDTFIPLDRRADIANNAKANLFISIHTNAVARGKSVQGAETYTLGLHRSEENLEVAKRENSVILVENDYQQKYAGFNPNSSESYIIFEFVQDKNMQSSVKLAKYIQSSFKNNVGRIDKGVHQAGFLVLRATSMPSVLVELGYISNPQEERYLLSEEGITQMARGIFKAFLNYKRDFDNKNRTSGNNNEAVVEQPQSEPDSNSIKVNTVQENTTKDTNEISNDYPYPVSTRNKNIDKKSTTPTSNNSKKSVSNNKKNLNSNKGSLIFKIQITTSDKLLKNGNKLFKGLSPVEYFKENGLYKYTYQADADYNKILKIKRSISNKFKDAFIIAFRNGEKVNINEAINEFKVKRQ